MGIIVYELFCFNMESLNETARLIVALGFRALWTREIKFIQPTTRWSIFYSPWILPEVKQTIQWRWLKRFLLSISRGSEVKFKYIPCIIKCVKLFQSWTLRMKLISLRGALDSEHDGAVWTSVSSNIQDKNTFSSQRHHCPTFVNNENDCNARNGYCCSQDKHSIQKPTAVPEPNFHKKSKVGKA